MRQKYSHQQGFTIVELLIVIVIIGILAAITIVAYNGIQQRARDSARVSDLNAVAKAYSLRVADKGEGLENTTCGNLGGGRGWYGSGGTSTVDQCLISEGYLSRSVKDPTGRVSCTSGDATCHAYLITNCMIAGQRTVYLYAYLESPLPGSSFQDGCGTGWSTPFFVNYTIKLTF